MDAFNYIHSVFFLIIIPTLSHGADFISANTSLSGNQTIISSGNIFVLGYFTPGNSSKFYVGIWYLVSPKTVVWVANRNIPISDPFSSHTKIVAGNLVVFNETQSEIWSTGLNSTHSLNLQAVLLDSGNLVLRETTNPPIWESFDFPTDTWLPGGSLGINKRTGSNQLLISWRNNEDPAPGIFSLELDPNGSPQYILLWNGSRRYWTSGPWNGLIFTLVPEMTRNYIYNFSYDFEGRYFTYSMKDTSIISKFVMDVSGQITQETWLNSTEQWNQFWAMPRQQCDVVALCGAYGFCKQTNLNVCECLPGFLPSSDTDWNLRDYSGGCVRKTPLVCRKDTVSENTKVSAFSPVSNMNFPDNQQDQVLATNAVDCESFCLVNCSCTAYAYESKCSVWFGDLLSWQRVGSGNGNGKTIYVKMNPADISSEKTVEKKRKTVVVVAMGAAAIAALGFLLVIFVILRKRRIRSQNPVDGSLISFRYRDLQTATKNFSEKLGGGGFGSVFKGSLPDMSQVAVKKLESMNQGEKQFRAEVITIGTIRHVNLIRLRGFFSGKKMKKKLLVYEYMQNGSLDSHLFKSEVKVLGWKTRYEIALGTAKGLVYLHEKCRDCIIHCDIKPENILLDLDFCPKVADFGLAKLVGRDFSRVLTTMRGTRGYLAPEWISGVAITAKADVYSYGMMVFEMVSGMRNSDPKSRFFPGRAAAVVGRDGDDGELMGMLDVRLEGNAEMVEVKRMCRVASWCVQDEETQRPCMSQVVQVLEGVLDLGVPPVPRCLQLFREAEEKEEEVVFFGKSDSYQNCSNGRSSSLVSSSVDECTTSGTSSGV